MFIIVVYSPDDYVEAVVEAMASAGAGEIGDYRACAFKVRGEGQFEPMPGAEPFIGDVGKLERVAETRIEMVVNERAHVAAALQNMLAAHPYEEPAYHVVEAFTLSAFMH